MLKEKSKSIMMKDSIYQTLKARQKKGITLIALVITIIVMLILVAVTITMAVNGGLFNYAGRAGSETNEAIEAEQQLANGKVNIDGMWYASIDDYLRGEVLVELPEGIKVGDYVNYTPDQGSYKISGEYRYGASWTHDDQSFTTEIGNDALKWRILSIDEKTGIIELIAANAGQRLELGGDNGYNHGVDILNDVCEALYSKTVKGTRLATGRSINIEDINKKTTYDFKTYPNYGTVQALSSFASYERYYPNLYKRETGFAPGGSAITGLGESEGLKDGVTGSNGLTTYSTVKWSSNDYDWETDSIINDVRVTLTYYYYSPEDYLCDLGINTSPLGLLDVGAEYWLASRCVRFYEGLDKNWVNFSLRSMTEDRVRE